MGPMYNHSKHAVLGMMRSLANLASPSLSSTSPESTSYTSSNIRVCSVHPWFADTAILEKDIRLVLRGLPWCSVDRVGGAIFRAATEPSPRVSSENEVRKKHGGEGVNGSAYLIPDDGTVFCLDRGQVDVLGAESCYDVLKERLASQAKCVIMFSLVWERYA